MDLLLFQMPTRLGSTFEALSGVEFQNPYALTLMFPYSAQDDARLTHAYASGDVARFIDALEAESITPIRRRSGWKLRLVAFSDTATEGQLRFHVLINNPTEFTDAQIRLAVIRAQRVLKLTGVAVSTPDWCGTWEEFAPRLIDHPIEFVDFEFELSRLFGIE